MITHPAHITINHRPQQVSQLLAQQARRSEFPRQAEVIVFLQEWYNDKSYIEVQSSGSTGRPKLLRLEKSFVVESAQRTIDFFQLKAGDWVLHCLPTAFIAGKLLLVRTLVGQLDVCLKAPDTSFDFLQHEHYAFAALVVNQMHKLWRFAPHIPIDKILLGGSAIPAALEEQLQEVSSACYSSYGMTETATHVALRKLNQQPKDHYYHGLNGISFRLHAHDCLGISMPGLPQELITNDVAQLLNSTTFQLVGRRDNCIISGGKKFYPEQIEQKLSAQLKHPFYIGAQKNDCLGEELILLVEAKETASLLLEISQIVEQLVKHERPRHIIFVDEFQRTANGKLRRNHREK